MYRSLTAVAMLLMGLYCAGSALWQLGNTAWFVLEAQRVPATVVDETKCPFGGIIEQLRHGNMPWDGDTAFRPHLRYVLYGRPIVDTTWPDLDNRSFVDGRRVTLLIHPKRPHQRHIDSPKFLWTGSCVLLLVGVFFLGTEWLLFKGRKKAATPQHVSRALAVREALAKRKPGGISERGKRESDVVTNTAGQDVVRKAAHRKRKKSEQADAHTDSDKIKDLVAGDVPAAGRRRRDQTQGEKVRRNKVARKRTKRARQKEGVGEK